MKNLRKLTVSRIAELKQLAEGVYQSQVNHVECVSDRGSLVTDLQIEALEMEGIFDSLYEFSMVCPTFFDTFDEVYYSFISNNPDKSAEAFGNYKAISNLFKLISSRSNLIGRKHNDFIRLHEDAEILEQIELDEHHNSQKVA